MTPTCVPPGWAEQLWPSLDQVHFAPTTLAERSAFSTLVPALLEAAPHGGALPKRLVETADAIGFRLEAWTANGETFWVLRERPGHYHGAGAYLIRTGPATSDVIQAPHVYFDLGTERVALSLFVSAEPGHRPRMFATNTAHRYRSHPGERREDASHPADLAHNPEHLFQHVTDLLARTLPGLRVFQVHGFAAKPRKDAPAIDAIVSAGTKTPTACVRTVATRLAPLLGQGVKLYPEEVGELGGTQNAQARLLQSYPNTRFVHLELSPTARRALVEPALSAKLAAALLAPFED